MKSRNLKTLARPLIACASVLGLMMTSVPAKAQSLPAAAPPYKISVFAKNPVGVSQPDSMVLWNDSLIVGFQNHVAKDGTDGKFSTRLRHANLQIKVR